MTQPLRKAELPELPPVINLVTLSRALGLSEPDRVRDRRSGGRVHPSVAERSPRRPPGGHPPVAHPGEYFAQFDTALEADGVAQKGALETVQFHGRELGQPVDEWITSTRPDTPQQLQEDQMFGRHAHAAAREQAQQEARLQAEADALFAEADGLDELTGERPGYLHQITAERAARIMAQLGEPLTREAREPLPALAGAELDAEIDRLAELYSELEPPGPDPGPDGARWSPLPDEPASQPDRHAHRYAGINRDLPGRMGEHGRGADADRDAPDHLYGSPECTEADPETAHFAWSGAEPEDAGRFPLRRVLDADQVSPVRALVAATLPDGTPHADPYLAERGWQANGGLYVRQPQAQLEAG